MASGLMEEPLDSFVPTERTRVRRLHASEGGTFHFATRLNLAHAAGEPVDIPPRELIGIIEASRAMKKRVRGHAARPLDGGTLAMIFDKPSTRTRVSFDVAKDRNNV